MILHLLIPFTDSVGNDLSMRYLLVETIQVRGMGQVLEEGTGQDGMHVILKMKNEQSTTQLLSLSKSLGLNNMLINEITD